MRFWRNTSVASLAPARRRPSPTAPSATSGTRTSTTARARRPRRHVLDHGRRPAEAPGLRLELRPGHRDPQPDPVPRSERGAGLRGRHDPVVVGARRQPRPRRLDARPAHAAGDGEPARRHGRPAGQRSRAASSPPPPRPTRSRPSSQIASPRDGANVAERASRPRSAAPPPTVAARRAARSAASRSRSTGASPGTRRRAAEAGATPGPRAPPAARRSRPAPSTTAATSRRPGAGVTVNVVPRTCPCSIWNDSFHRRRQQ